MRDAEVGGTPTYIVSWTEEPGGGAADGFLACFISAAEVEFDASREVEATLDGCGDESGEFQMDQRGLGE